MCVVGARPNFVKMAPLVHAFGEHADVDVRICNTGQHYDRALAGSFIEQLGMPLPDHDLGVGSDTHARQTAAVLIGVEDLLLAQRPDAVVVAGDVNSTMGAALAGAKLGIPIAHLEAGLRSGDWTMPEEINRVVTDRISDLLLCHCDDAVDNLLAEGVNPERLALVGNTMIDSLFKLLPLARATDALQRHGLQDGGYILVTLHRPALVDDPLRLASVLEVLAGFAEQMPVIFPLHPRTRARLQAAAPDALARLRIVEPLEYLDFIALQAAARLVVTDSGGVQEETSALGVPCLTYRDNTERPVTCELGTNRVVGVDPEALAQAGAEELSRVSVTASPIPLWDGHAGERAADAVLALVDDRRRAAAQRDDGASDLPAATGFALKSSTLIRPRS